MHPSRTRLVLAGILAAASPLLGDRLVAHAQAQQQQQQAVDPLVKELQAVREIQNAGRHQEALQRATALAAAAKARLGENHAFYATTIAQVGYIQFLQSRYADAEKLHRASLAIRERALGSDHVDVANSLALLGDDVRALNRFAEAEQFYKRALAIQEKSVGTEHGNIAYLLTGLGRLSTATTTYGDAEFYHKRALAIREKTLAADSPLVAVSLLDLADVYRFMARPNDAEPLYRRALAIYEKTKGTDQVDVAGPLTGLGRVAFALGRFSDAESFYRRALAVRQKALGDEHLSVAVSLQDVAEVSRLLSRHEEAEQLYRRALAINEKLPGGELNVSGNLISLGFLYLSLNRYADAETLSRRAVSIRERARGPDHVDVAYGLAVLADALRFQSRFAEAESLYQRALAIEEKTIGAEHANVAGVVSGLGHVSYALARYADAEFYFKRAFAVRAKHLGADSTGAATSLADLATTYHAMSHFSEAEQFYKRALEINQKAQGRELSVAWNLNNLGSLYSVLARYAEAEELQRKALAIREKMLGPENAAVADTLIALAATAKAQNRNAEAEQLLKRSLAIRTRVDGPESTSVADGENDLAVHYLSLGRYAEAERLHKHTLAVREKLLGFEHPRVAISLGNIAEVQRQTGRENEAEPLLRRALAIKEKVFGLDNISLSVTLGALASVNFGLGRSADAEAMERRGLAIAEKAVGKDHPAVASRLEGLSDILAGLDRTAEAEALETRTLAIREKAYGQDHWLVSDSLRKLAFLYERTGRNAEAEPLLKRALAARQKSFGSKNLRVAGSLSDLADLYGKTNRLEEALALSRTAIGVLSDSTVTTDGVGQDLASLKKHFNRNIALLRRTFDDKSIGKQAVAESFAVAQVANRSAAALALNQTAARFGAGDDRLASLVRDNQDAIAELRGLDKNLLDEVSKTVSERDLKHEEKMRARASELEVKIAQTARRIAEEFPRYAEFVSPKALSPADVQQHLRSDEALIVFHVTDRASYVWAVTGEAATWRQINLSGKDLDARVQKLRADLTVDAASFDLDGSLSLYKAVLGPVDDVIAKKGHLLVVPSGALASLPFHVLVTETRGQSGAVAADLRDAAWLVRRHAVTVLPSVSSLKNLREATQRAIAPEKYLGLGNPVFNTTVAFAPAVRAPGDTRQVPVGQGARANVAGLAKALPSLPETADELIAVARALRVPDGQVKLGKNATEAFVKTARLSDYRILHFATHGLVAGETAVFTGQNEPSLALTLPQKPTSLDDGLLTASEVAKLTLNADWVILSACNTAAGDTPGAEPLSGLARAFFYAGARTLMVSHWPVQSQAAVRLVTTSIQSLDRDATLSSAEALRRAMLDMIDDNSDERNARPGIWAPFVIVGLSR